LRSIVTAIAVRQAIAPATSNFGEPKTWVLVTSDAEILDDSEDRLGLFIYNYGPDSVEVSLGERIQKVSAHDGGFLFGGDTTGPVSVRISA